jgi:hypothetical protein
MVIHPDAKSVGYSMDSLADVLLAIEDAESVALESDGVDAESARQIVGALNVIRSSLNFKAGVRRHPKFSSEKNT